MKLRFLLPAVLVAAGAVYAQAPSNFDDCDRFVLQHPDEAQGYRCYVALAGRNNGWDDAARRLDALVAVDPDNHLAKLALASLEARRGGDRAEPLYLESIQAFRDGEMPSREITARLEYAGFLSFRSRTVESDEQRQAAMSIAIREGDPLLSAIVSIDLARSEYFQAAYEAAERRLLKVRETVFKDGDLYQRARWLGMAGSVRWGMARFSEALQDFHDQAEIFVLLNDPYEESVARSNVVLLASNVSQPPYTEETLQRLITLIGEAQDAAQRGGNRGVEGKLELYLAQLVPDAVAVRRHLEQGLAICREVNDREDMLLATRLLSESLLGQEPRDPERGLKLLQSAVTIAEQSGSPQDLARTRIVQATVQWDLLRNGDDAAGDREAVIGLSIAALDAIEAIRDSQSGGTVRARTFSPWTFFYKRIIDELLLSAETDPLPDDPDLAFRITERMRAQVFLEELDAVDAGREPDQLPWSGLSGIGLVQERLGEDEAILSFVVKVDSSISQNYSTGSWLTVLTRSDRQVYRLPSGAELQGMVDLTLGAIRNRDGSELSGLERLSQDLLSAPLHDLSEAVDHLIIVADGPLHRVPFAALVEGRYRISQAPSVAAWLHWTGEQVEPAAKPASVWIDPLISGANAEAIRRGPPLGRLPYAALEARSAEEALGRGTQVHGGSRATEARFKGTALGEFGIIHVAAHAVVDDLHPDLSGIVLASGEGEDGLLQVREIVNLDLTGRTVILSACRSASGATLEGEGVLSLARAFFVAGAQAVVANLWPVRDDEAAAFSADLYRHLGEGKDIASALTHARRDRIEAGDSTEAWAGTVLFGNGRVVPFDGEARQPWWSWLWLVLIAGIMAAYAGFRGARLQRR
jgi:hypothetical protein